MPITLEYLHEGSEDCPLIRLYGFDATDAIWLRDRLASLSSGALCALELHDDARVHPINGCRLVLKASGRDRGIVRTGAEPTFAWELTADGWSDAAWLMGPFTAGHSNGFQWLDRRSDIALLLSPSGEW